MLYRHHQCLVFADTFCISSLLVTWDSSSSITSFNASVICSVDFTGRTLLIGGINPLGGGGGGVPWLVSLVVTKDVGTFVTDSCCVFEVEG